MVTGIQQSDTDGPAAPAFSVAVPADWIMVDPDEAQDREAVAKVVDSRVERGNLPPEYRDAAVDMVVRVASQACEMGVRFAALLVATDASGPVVASVTLASALVVLSGDEPATGEHLVSLKGTPDPVAAFQPAGAQAMPATVTQIRLPAGPAVRIERTVPVELGEFFSQDVYTVQYVVPVDERGSAIVMTCTSPAARRKDDLDRIFEEIAQTLEIERPPR